MLVAKMAASVLEIDAWAVADARERRDLPALARARQRAAEVLKAAEAAVAKAGRGEDDRIAPRGRRVHRDQARAFHARLDGRDESTSWDALAGRWESLAIPYGVARARWRQAEAALSAGDGRPGRASARRPLLEAVRIARELGARPLLRELEELAGRARIPIPEAGSERGRAGPFDSGGRVPVMAGLRRSDRRSGERRHGPRPAAWPGSSSVPARPKAAVFGLSPREREVLLLLSAGRTNREIGEHLFISQKTVGVHVGNILSKLGVSGRVEAAAVAIRLGLTDRR